MKRPLTALCSLILCAATFPIGSPLADIAWRADFNATLEAAKTEGKVVFVAVNMDGERANDRMAQEAYKQKDLVTLAQHTLNLVASNAVHKESGACPRFGTITCAEHRAVDIRVREKVLKPDAGGYVIAPQHVFLGPDGKVLLSVPYEVTAEELEWCFVKALKLVNPKLELSASSKAHAPKRLLMADVIDTAASGESGTTQASPPTRAELLELIKEIKKGRTPDRPAKLRRILSADEPEALDYITVEMRGLKSKGEDPGQRHRELLSDIGRLSPPSYWELVSDLCDNSREDVRAAVAACLEQLASPDSLKTIKAALRKEKVASLEGNWLRAMASAAPADKQVRQEVIKNAAKAREATVRVQSIVALGYLVAGDDVSEAMAVSFESEDPTLARAAACAMAISRDSKWLETLKAKSAKLTDGELKQTIDTSVEVLTQGRLELLGSTLMDVCHDSIARPRFYGPGAR